MTPQCVRPSNYNKCISLTFSAPDTLATHWDQETGNPIKETSFLGCKKWFLQYDAKISAAWCKNFRIGFSANAFFHLLQSPIFCHNIWKIYLINLRNFAWYGKMTKWWIVEHHQNVAIVFCTIFFQYQICQIRCVKRF